MWQCECRKALRSKLMSSGKKKKVWFTVTYTKYIWSGALLNFQLENVLIANFYKRYCSLCEVVRAFLHQRDGLCYGGHLGRHFENDSFPDVGFQGNFSMLFMISSTIQIRWKTFCIINWKIYNHLQAMAAILDAILKIIAFPMWDFGGLLVCYLWYQILPKSVEKPLV